MIKINLAPIEELENKFWFLPDLVFVVVIGVSSYLGVQFFLGEMEAEIIKYTEERRDFKESLRRLKPDLERVAALQADLAQLDKKMKSLEEITVSKIARFKPIILLEHLQNVKPEGLWFNFLKDESNDSIIRLVGAAFDNLLVAEFMSALTETRIQEVDATDLRTQVFFPRVHLERVATTGAGKTDEKVEKTKAYQAFASTQDQKLKESKASGYWSAHTRDFPEMAKFPGFEMNIRYAEREVLDRPLSISEE